jgi:hypothetical protein
VFRKGGRLVREFDFVFWHDKSWSTDVRRFFL